MVPADESFLNIRFTPRNADMYFDNYGKKFSLYNSEKQIHEEKKTNNNIPSNHNSRNLRITVDRGFFIFF